MSIAALIASAVLIAGPAVMALGLIVMFASLARRGVGSPTAARLLFIGPGVSLIGGALMVAGVEFDVPVRVVLFLLLLASGIGVCAVALRAQIRFAPIKR